MDTVFAAFKDAARSHAPKPFLSFPRQRVDLSYGETLERVDGLAARYAARGYGAGHRVGLHLDNRPEFLIHFLALNSLGASIVPLNPDSKPAEVDYIRAHSEACLVIDAAFLEGSREIPPAPTPGDAAECALLYTSGTTGKPKGC